MLSFSKDPNVAEQQMRAIIFYMTAFGYIDGDFDLSEKTFIRAYIRELVEARARQAIPDADSSVRSDVIERFVTHFHEVFEEIDRDIRSFFTEVVGHDEKPEEFVYSRLKLRSYEVFKSFDRDNQLALLETATEIIEADGQVHPAEAKFRDEVRALLDAEIPIVEVGERAEGAGVEIDQPVKLQARQDDHPFFARSEDHYSRDPIRIRKQSELDYQLIVDTMKKLDEQRAGGHGRLDNVRRVDELAGEKPFLDRHIYVHPVEPGTDYELIVLGDLHGCYSCLKAALMQSDFFAKVEAHRLDPQSSPAVKLVLLGDYIDRGRYSYNGVLRTVMQLFLTNPEHVYMLRGNHEYYVEYRGRIYGGVRPAEAINTLVGYLPKEMFEAYMKLFESLPNMLLFDKTLFVHAGIARDVTLRDKYQNLSSLNDPEIRFQMLWSDPSEADFIPDDLQAENARFPFGRLQFERFMNEIGCNTMVRGHEKVVSGFRSVYPDGPMRLINLFSAGGATNEDLPPDSSYRDVTPMALTITVTNGVTKLTPWEIDYQRYNDPHRNRFFASPPEIEHKAE